MSALWQSLSIHLRVEHVNENKPWFQLTLHPQFFCLCDSSSAQYSASESFQHLDQQEYFEGNRCWVYHTYISWHGECPTWRSTCGQECYHYGCGWVSRFFGLLSERRTNLGIGPFLSRKPCFPFSCVDVPLYQSRSNIFARNIYDFFVCVPFYFHNPHGLTQPPHLNASSYLNFFSDRLLSFG